MHQKCVELFPRALTINKNDALIHLIIQYHYLFFLPAFAFGL